MPLSLLTLPLLFSLALAQQNSFLAPTEINCSHPQVCNLIRSCLPKNSNIQLKLLFQIKGDAHTSEPKTSEIMALTKAPYLVSGPFELGPWIQKIIKQRQKNSALRTITLELPLEEKKKSKNPHALAHFWAYPSILAETQKHLALGLSEWGIACEGPLDLSQIQDKIKALAGKIQGKKIILGHDALAPFFENLGAQVFSLKTSEHHDEISPKTVKKLYQLIKTEKAPLFWALDPNSPLPASILNLKRKNDKELILFIEGQMGESPTKILENLLQTLENHF